MFYIVINHISITLFYATQIYLDFVSFTTVGKNRLSWKKYFLKLFQIFFSFPHYLFFMHMSKISIPEGKGEGWGGRREIL